MARKQQNLQRRGNSWIVYFRAEQGGKQISKSFADRDFRGSKKSATAAAREAALLYLEQSRVDLRRNDFRLPSTVLFRDYAATWLDEHPTIDPRTKELYHQRIRDYLNPVLGHIALSSITTEHVKRVKTRTASLGRSGWTQKGVLALLSGILAYAIPDHITHNPVAALKKRDRPKSREGGRGPKRILTTEELRQLLAAAGEHGQVKDGRDRPYQPILAVAAYAGLRLSEVLALTWGDVDFDAETIHVQKQLSVPNRYDPTPAHRVDLKSDSDEGAERKVFLADDLAAVLKAHRGERIPRSDEYLFTTSNGTPYQQRNIGRIFDEALDAAGIEWKTKCEPCGWTFMGPASEARAARLQHLATAHAAEQDTSEWKWVQEGKPTFHSLRHTFASAIIAGGADQGHVARLLGHTDPSFTYKVYVHEFDRAQRQAASKAALGSAYSGVLA